MCVFLFLLLHKDDDHTSVSHPLTREQSPSFLIRGGASHLSSPSSSFFCSFCSSSSANAAVAAFKNDPSEHASSECPLGHIKNKPNAMAETNSSLFRRGFQGLPAQDSEWPPSNCYQDSRQQQQQQQLARRPLHRWRAGGLVHAHSLKLISTDKNEAKQLKLFNDAFFFIRDNESLR